MRANAEITENRVPEWARAEHMEMSVPQSELWRMPENDAREGFFARLARLFG